MGSITLSSILLFALVIPFIMTYRLSPDTTPFWLFGLIFLGLLVNIVLDLRKISENKYFILKSIMLGLIIVAVIGSAFFASIVVRRQTAPIYGVHDIILQQESAIRFLLHGKNPYATTYFGTPLEDWNYSDKEINPALYHFVMQPFYLIFAIPFYGISVLLFGFSDARLPLIFLFLVLLIAAYILVKDKEQKLLFVTLLAFNPAILGYTLEGRSDIFMYTFLFIGFMFLYYKRFGIGGIALGFAFAIKQSAWPILPLYVGYLIYKNKNVKGVIKNITPFLATFFLITLPFVIWDSKAFIDSTLVYLSGSSTTSYPISGYGFGMLLHEMGFIKDLKVYYPFILWQGVVGIPILVFLLMYLKKNPSVKRLIVTYGIFLFIFWYFSRYFNNSHVAYLSVVFITAYFWPSDKPHEK